LAPRGEGILQLPGEPDAGVVVRAARPPRPLAPHHRLPEARQAVGEAIERGAEPHVLDEGERGARGADAPPRLLTEAVAALALERLAVHALHELEAALGDAVFGELFAHRAAPVLDHPE